MTATRWPIALATAAGLGLTVLATRYVQATTQERLEARFMLASAAQAAACRQRLESRLEVLSLLADHFAVRGEVTRAEFAALARGALARHPEVRALEWVPVVPEAGRRAFEARARLEGAPAFRLTDRDARGRLVPARARPVHYPILYVEPLAGNERALGYAPDLPPRDAAIAEARDAARPVATAGFTPVQPAEGHLAVAIFAPVYRPDPRRPIPVAPAGVEGRRQAIRGFVEGVLVIGETLAGPAAVARAAGMDLALLDASAPAGGGVLYAAGPTPGTAPGLRNDVPIDAAGRRWVLSFRLADPRAFEPFRGPELAVGLAGLAGTGLLAAYLASTLAQRDRVERLVVDRTRSLKDEEERARSYLDVAAAVIVKVEPDGTVGLVNRQGSELLGWPQEDIVGQDWFERFVPADHRAEARARIAGVQARPGGSATYEGRVLTAAGEERLIAWHTTCLPSDGGAPCATLSSGADVTEYKRAVADVAQREAELRHAHELDRLRDEFAHAISHDLRSPLTAILGYAEFLDDEVGGRLTPAQHTYVGQVIRGVRRLEGLVDDLLDHARLEGGKLRLQLAASDLGATLRAVAESFGPRAEATGVALVLAGGAAPLLAMMDADRVERVVTNLLFNAIKFTPPGGTITLAARREGGEVVCEVADTGPGIAPDQVDQLFKRFSQLPDGAEKGGTGLGLSISREIVEAHGGAIGVRSVPGEGATFWFSLPAAEG